MLSAWWYHIEFEIEDKIYPTGIYMLKVNNKNTRTRCGICSKSLTSGVFIVNFGLISHLVLVFLLLALNM